MNKKYIKPVTEIVRFNAVVNLLSDSTKWYTDTSGKPVQVDDENEPDPNGGSGAKEFWGTNDLWEDDV